jgi:predicted nucleotidyltransferase
VVGGVASGWIAERGMSVFTMRDPNDPLRQVELFLDEPIPFEELWERSDLVTLEGMSVRIAAIPDLILMKELAGRPIDEEDIAELRRIQREGSP